MYKYIHIVICFFISFHLFAQKEQCQPFAESILFDKNIFKGCFTPDGQSLYFFKKVGKGETYKIFKTEFKDSSWSKPDTVFLGNSPSDLYPIISPDGNYLVFTSNRKEEGYEKNSYLWIAERTTHGWSEPQFIKNLSREGKYHSNTYFTPDGNIIYRVTEKDWIISTTYISNFVDGTFSTPKPYTPVERWKEWRKDISIWGGAPGPNNDSVILDISLIDETGKKSKSDQWISSKMKSGEWSEPKPLPNCINQSESWDTHIFYSADRKTMFFVRDFKSIFSYPVKGIL